MGQAEKYLRPEIIKQIARLDLKAKFIVEGFIAGLHGSPFHGFSVEFSEHRKYEPGDEISSIDWSVYGRTDRYFVKKYRAETNTQCHLVVDVSPSMGYGRGELTKLDYATCIAAALGFLMIGQQDPVGLITFDEKIRSVIPPKSKRGHLTVLLGELAKISPGKKTNISGSLHETAELLKRRGLVVLFSDLLEDPAKVLQGLSHLAFRRHDIILFHILDESEVTFPFRQLAFFEDPETGERILADPRGVRDAYCAQVEKWRADLKEQVARSQIDYVPLHTGMAFDKALTSYLHARMQRA